ncbi:DNA primase [Schlesneria paludicola]|uniref:DNA primase n=1 Tax=Schlesneria paludicola TaxID=360056 RepID=UPI00029B4573|nr:DNA primase [Schlesneria paludicola]
MSANVGASPDEFKELVRARTDIVQLIGETVALFNKGRDFKGLCPFHDDHNPSFTVNPERQTYMCWSCRKGGDCFSFVMENDRINFRETLELLAKRAGLELPASYARGPAEPKEKPHLYDALEWAEKEFHHCLLTTAIAERARNYLHQRGFNSASIAKFKLGYHPDSWDWLLQRAKGRFDPELLVRASLAKERDSASGYGGSGFYDQFVDRVMFPIHDERGRTVAFGGRILPDSKAKSDAKYLNSSETPVFSKSRVCYALDVARDAIKKTGIVMVMEGYADCVKAHQGGILNAVATLGTALTETHVTVLKRLASRVILIFDGDRAGVEAAEKAIPRFLSQDVDLRILTVPDELDPDEFIDQRGGDALLRLAEDAPDAIEYQLRLLLNRHGKTTLNGRQQVLEGMLNLLTLSPGIVNSLKEDLLVGRLPQRLGISEVDVRKRLKQIRSGQPATTSRATDRKIAASSPGGDPTQIRRAQLVDSLQRNLKKDEMLECEFLHILFTHPDLIHAARQEIGLDDVRHEALREILSIWFDMHEEAVEPSYDRMLARIECPELKRLVVWIEDQSPRRTDPKSSAGSSAVGTESAEAGLQRVIEGMKWRRSHDAHEASKSLLVERPSETANLTAESRAVLEQALRFHRKRTAK